MIAMSGLALAVFVALFFVKAGYGMFTAPSWGFAIHNKAGWAIMEAPAFITMLLLWVRFGAPCTPPVFVFFLFFEAHYFQRTAVFPFLMRGKSLMPLSVIAMGVVFNVVNALMQAEGLFHFPPANLYDEGWRYFARPAAVAGTAVFVCGMIINLHSDYVIRNLRSPGDTRHYLPQKGLYRFVTSANYFGELVEWAGFALLTHSPAAWVFVWWTAANLAPRADSIHSRYIEEFGRDAVGKRRRLIPFVY